VKTKVLSILFLLIFTVFQGAYMSEASEMDVLVDKLVEKGILTPYEAQILKAEAKESAAKELAEGTSVTAPSWTQRIKIKGDVRFRVQEEWGKGLEPAHQRIRERVRARLGIEGKVNDQVSAGILAVTGGNDPRSTNQTLDDGFETYDFRLDQYYIKWRPDLDEKIGKGTLWLGKFKNPFKKTPLVWDGDISPTGVAVQYESPEFSLGDMPGKLYSNFGFLFVDELRNFQNDPLMFVGQVGTEVEVNPEWGSTVNVCVSYYDMSHIKGNGNGVTFTGNSGTNSRYAGAYSFDFNWVDIIVEYDSKRLFKWDVGNGLYSDIAWNTDPGNQNFAWMIGGYLGTKKPKKPGQWKLRGEYRYLEKDSIPDFLPDSDFYGFTDNGVPAAGGTNGQGFVAGANYALLRNTVLGVTYYYCWPINLSVNGQTDEPYQLIQCDVNVKY